MNLLDLHPAYFKVRFRGPWPDLSHPEEFAIITAYATTGETWSEPPTIPRRPVTRGRAG
jgi:hypothetical protein